MIKSTTAIALSGISVPTERLRALRQDHVDTLAESMAQVGLIHPVMLRKRAGRGYWLVTGAHRVAAAEKLHWMEIDCVVVDACSEDEATLLEIDENLARNELSPAERAMHIDRRKAIYERMHPETKPTTSGGRNSRRQVGDDADRFTKDTAAKTGQSERKVQRDATRAKRLGDDLKRVTNTSLDKGAELDALAKLKPQERAQLIERAEAGEKVSAIRQHAPVRSTELTRTWNAFRGCWLKANGDERAAFLDTNKKQINAVLGANDGA